MDVTLEAMVNEMIARLESAKVHAVKFDNGNNAAGTRVRGVMQEMKKQAQVARNYVSEKKAK